MRINRVMAGGLAASLGAAGYLLYPRRSLALAIVVGAYTAMDRFGWISSPYEPTMRELLHQDESPEKSQFDRMLSPVEGRPPLSAITVTSIEEAESCLRALRGSAIDTNGISLFELERRLRETMAWCERHADTKDPAGSLRRLSVDPNMAGIDWRATVDDVVARRRAALKDFAITAAPTSDGGFLVYRPDDNLADGAAAAHSGGFFDDDNVPPCDTWIGFFEERYLLAWVPGRLTSLVDSGLAVHVEECVQWIDRTTVGVRPVVEFLQRRI